MTKKTTFILIGIGIFLAAVLWLIFGLSKNSGNNKNTLSIPVSGGSVEVNDFTQKPVETTTGAVALAETSYYNIVYFTKEHHFLITLNDSPAVSRPIAESAFLNILKVTQNDACRLSVSIMVPFEIDPKLSGNEYGLSFCPGAKTF